MIIVGKMEMYGLWSPVQMLIDTVSTVKTAPSDAFMKNMSYYLWRMEWAIHIHMYAYTHAHIHTVTSSWRQRIHLEQKSKVARTETYQSGWLFFSFLFLNTLFYQSYKIAHNSFQKI